jgi:hypothetical protein
LSKLKSGAQYETLEKGNYLSFAVRTDGKYAKKVSIGYVHIKLSKEGQWNFTEKNNYRELLEWFSLKKINLTEARALWSRSSLAS